MTDDFDVSLRRRLESLASAVPLAQPGEVTAVSRQPVRARSTSRLALVGLLPVLVVVVIGAVVASLLKIGPGPGDSSAGSTEAANGPIESITRSGDFELTIRSAKARYAVGEPIDIGAALTFVGEERPGGVQIGHALGADDGPLGFGIEEPVIGDLHLTPGTQDACARTALIPGQPITAAFAKSAGWSGDDPRSDDYLAFVRDPVLRLRTGTWHVYAIAAFSLGDCSPDPIAMRVDLTIVVDGTLAPIDGPVLATDSNGDFELTIRSPKGRYVVGEPIAVEATFAYAGDEPVQIVDNEGDGEPLTFGIEEPVVGDLILGPSGYLPCISTTIEPGHTQVSEFVKSGGWTSDDPFAEQIEAFFRDPELRLSEGTWHIWAAADFFVNECGADRVELRVEIPIEVTPPASTDTPEPQPTDGGAESTDDPSLGAVEASDYDGTFRLELRSTKSGYAAGEPIDVKGTLTYVGPKESVEVCNDSYGPIAFGIRERVFGAIRVGSISTLMGDMTTFDRGVPLVTPFQKGGGFSGDDPDADQYKDWLLDPELWLPEGTWHLTAHATGGPGCGVEAGPPFDLRAEITIVVATA